tara:strand:+ start:1020 stop:1343 length:324 start_codon:yes stop_codon:yes gene_type:complete
MKMSKYDVDFQYIEAMQATWGPKHCKDFLNVLIKRLKSGIHYKDADMYFKKNHLREGGNRYSLVSQEDLMELQDMSERYDVIFKLLCGLSDRVKAIAKKGIEIKWEQ